MSDKSAKQDHHLLRRATAEDRPGAARALALELPAFVLEIDHHARRDQRAMLGRKQYPFAVAKPDFAEWSSAHRVANDLLADFKRSADTPEPRLGHFVHYLF